MVGGSRARPSKICGIFCYEEKLFQVPLMRTWLCLVLADLLLDLFTLKNGDQFSGSKRSRDIDDLAWSPSEELYHRELTEPESLDAELSSPGSCTPHQRWSWTYESMIHIVQAGTSWLTRGLRWSSWTHLWLACFCPQLSLTCWTYLSCTREGMSQEWPSINEVPLTALTGEIWVGSGPGASSSVPLHDRQWTICSFHSLSMNLPSPPNDSNLKIQHLSY